MAPPTAFSMHAHCGAVVLPKKGVTPCLMQSMNSKPHFLSVDMNDKKAGRGQSGRLLFNNRFQCKGLELERTVSNLTEQKPSLSDVIDAQQFDRSTLSYIFEVAREMESIEKYSQGNQMLKGFLMATLFYEPSTRTRLSFESAMKRLGGEVLTTENAREFSSAAKGETLEGQ